MCLALVRPQSVGNLQKKAPEAPSQQIGTQKLQFGPKAKAKTRTNRCVPVGSQTEKAEKDSWKRPQHRRQKRKMQKSCFPDGIRV